MRQRLTACILGIPARIVCQLNKVSGSNLIIVEDPEQTSICVTTDLMVIPSLGEMVITLLSRIRSRAMIYPGFLSRIILEDVNKPDQMVIHDWWQNLDWWDQFQQEPDYLTIFWELQPLLAIQPTMRIFTTR